DPDERARVVAEVRERGGLQLRRVLARDPRGLGGVEVRAGRRHEPLERQGLRRGNSDAHGICRKQRLVRLGPGDHLADGGWKILSHTRGPLFECFSLAADTDAERTAATHGRTPLHYRWPQMSSLRCRALKRIARQVLAVSTVPNARAMFTRTSGRSARRVPTAIGNYCPDRAGAFTTTNARQRPREFQKKRKTVLRCSSRAQWKSAGSQFYSSGSQRKSAGAQWRSAGAQRFSSG